MNSQNVSEFGLTCDIFHEINQRDTPPRSLRYILCADRFLNNSGKHLGKVPLITPERSLEKDLLCYTNVYVPIANNNH
jgi:hypothetical protein